MFCDIHLATRYPDDFAASVAPVRFWKTQQIIVILAIVSDNSAISSKILGTDFRIWSREAHTGVQNIERPPESKVTQLIMNVKDNSNFQAFTK
jgi:hypothetical protein